MALTSAAEAKLDARIRPDITILRSRTPYPRRHRPALAVLPGGADRHAVAEVHRAATTRVWSAPVARQAAAARAHVVRSAAPRPIRLTRRGRIVIAALAAFAVAGVAALIWLVVAGRAQAAGHVRPGTAAAHSMLRVVVRPGDTLWGIATKADPNADPRIVIRQIMDDNALGGTAITAGQVLWVPRI